MNRLSFGIALFIVLTMVIPAPSSVFSSLIQPITQNSRSDLSPSSLFSISNAAAFSTTSSFPPIITNSSFSTTNTTPKIVGTTQANTTVKLFDGTTQIGSVASYLPSAGQIFAIGGYTGAATLNTLNKYNPTTNTWTPLASMPTSRMSLASATDLSGNIYAIGGNNAGPLSTVEKYNPATNTWSTVASMPTARTSLAATTDLSGNIYALGGDNGNGTYYNNVEKYNPATNTWSTVASMPSPSTCLGAVTDPSGNIYALGGQFNNAGLLSAFRYNATTNTWTGLPPISAPFMPGCTGGVASDLSGNIYVMGGFSVPSAVYQSTVEKYNPHTNSWSTVASLPASDAFFASATDLSGNIYAIGGVTPVSSAVYKYNSTTNSWSTVASLPQAASNLAATTPFMAKWSITPTLSLGAHTITANATDAAANTSPNSAPITVTVNAPPYVTPPTVTITSPVNSTTITSSDITITGIASDSGSGVNNTQVSIDGTAYQPANGTTSWSFTKHGLANGVHTILVKATDNAGNNGFSFGSNTVSSNISGFVTPFHIAYDSANGYLYVTNSGVGSVSVINDATNTIVGSSIAVGNGPNGIAFDPANGFLYVVNQGSNSVSVINGATNTIVGSPISVGNSPYGIAFDPANGYLYVTNNGASTVSVINGATNTIVGSPISVGVGPLGIAYDSANGNVYVTNYSDSTISVINGATNTIVGSPISVGNQPYGIAFDPANGYLYVANYNGNTVSVINGATNTIVGSPIAVGNNPTGIAFDPANGYLYVANYHNSDTISVINGATNTIVGSQIPVGNGPVGIAYDSANGYLYVADQQSGNTVSVISTPTFFTSHAPTFQANTIYAIGGGTNSGGTNAVNAYNPGTNTWTSVAPLPDVKNGHAAATDLAGNIYAMGGNNNTGTTNTVYKYTPSTNTWTSVAPMPFASIGLAATTDLAGNIYAMGGNHGGTYLNNVARYNVTTNTWTSVAPLPVAIQGLVAATDFAGKIYAIGGYTASGSLDTVYKYDPVANSWTSVASMSTIRGIPAVATDLSGNIYSMGGQDVSVNGPIYNTVEKYNPGTNTWGTVASMPTARSGGAGATDYSGNIYAMGGEPALFSPFTNEVDKYNVTTNTWTTVASLPVGVEGFAAVAAPAPTISSATKLVYTAGTAQILNTGTASTAITVQEQDSSGNPVNAGASGVTVNLSSTSSGGKFDTSQSGAFDGTITSVTIPSGSSSVTFYYKDTTAGTPTMTAVSSGLTSAITGTYLSQFGTAGSGNGQFNLPFGIALDSSGNIYVTDYNNARVEKFNSAGVYQSQFGSTGSGNGQFSNPRGIALDSAGNIYVVDTFNDRVEKFNSAGVYQSQFGSLGSGNGQFVNPVEIAIDSFGNIYVVDGNNARVEKFNSAGVYQSQFGSTGSGNGQFSSPEGIAIDSSGNIYVIDQNNNRVEKFNSAGVYQSQFGSTGSGNGQFQHPYGITVDSSGNIHVGDSSNNRVEEFNSAGVYLSQFGSLGSGNGQFNGPITIALDSSGNIYVTDFHNNRVEKFSSSITIITSVPLVSITSPANGASLSTTTASVTGTSSDTGSTIRSVQVSVDGGAYAAATSTGTNFSTWSFTTPTLSNGVHTILAKATDDAGNSAISYGTSAVIGSPIPVGTLPWGVASDPANGDIYVANVGDGTATVINGTTNTLATGFTNPITVGTDPTYIAYDSANGDIYVANNNGGGAGTVSVINGTTNTVVGSPISVGHGPQGITFDSTNGYLYVANIGDGTVSVINGATNTVVGSPISVGANPLGIAFDPANGYVYVGNSNGGHTVTVINGTTNTLATGFTNPITVGMNPVGIAYDSANNNIYVANNGDSTVTVINSTTNTVIGSPISVGANPEGIAFDSTNGNLYVPAINGNDVTVINGATNTVIGSPIPVGNRPYGVSFDSANGDIYVTNQNDINIVAGGNTVSVISTPTFFTVNTATFPSSSTVSSAIGAGTVSFQTNSGGFASLSAISQSTLGHSGLPQNVVLPFGAFSFNVTGITPGGTATITLNLPSPVPTNTQYWKFQGGHWVNATSLRTITNGGNTMVLTITDGGFGDADGVANGQIIDPGALVVAHLPPPHIVILSPLNGTSTSSSSTTITGIASCANCTDIVHVKVSIDGSLFSLANGTTSWSFTQHGLANGVHTILAKAVDGSGNVGFSYGSNTVTGSPIRVSNPYGIAFDPANSNLYVANVGSNTVSVINSTTNSVIGSPISVGTNPYSIAFDPTNDNLYVTNSGANTVSVINGTTNTVIDTITVGGHPYDITYDLENGELYVSNNLANTVSVINGTTNAVIGSQIVVGGEPYGIRYDLANNNIYVVNQNDNSVSVINGTTNTVIGSPITVGNRPDYIAYDSANGNLYVSNQNDNSVSVINGTTDGTLDSTIPVGTTPFGIAFDPANGNIYVANQGDHTVSVINGTTNAVTGSPIALSGSFGIAYNSANGNLYVTNNAGAVSRISTPTFFTVNVAVPPTPSVPLVSITSPTNGQLFSTNTVSVTGTSSDVGSTISSVQVSVDGDAYSAATNTGTAFSTWSFTTPTLSNGIHTLKANATDANGNFAVTTIPFTTDQAASLVIGQPDFASNAFNGGTSAKSLNFPQISTFDSSGNLWVADANNNRILEYRAPFSTNESASLVIGQPDFTSNGIASPINASSINGTNDIAFDSAGDLWTADGNSRVLEFKSPFTNGMAASVVIGEPNFTTSANRFAPPTASTLSNPNDVTFDSSGNLWVADSGNRVLEFKSPFTNGMAASLVLGQQNFTSNVLANPPTANSLYAVDLAFDSSGNLWVSDLGDYRILEFRSPFTNGMAASLVLGQQNFTSNATPATPTASSLSNTPLGIAFDPSGNLWVSDASNNRVLKYQSPFSNGMAASLVLGQPDFTSKALANPPTASSLNGTYGIAFDPSGNLWVTDANNNRVLEYTTSFTVNAASSFPSSSSVPSLVVSGSSVNFATSSGGFASLAPVLQSTLATSGLPHTFILPYGVFSFNVTGVTPGSTDTINMTLPFAVKSNAQYWKIENGHWINATSLRTITNNGHNVILTITDGGFGDSDGTANGNIVDPGALVIPTLPPHIAITSPANGTAITSASVTITGTAVPANSTITSVSLSLDNGPFHPANGTTSWSFTKHGLANGVHTILARATDVDGNNGYTYGSNVVGLPISVGTSPYEIVQDFNHNLFVSNNADNTVSVINSTTNTPEGSPISVGTGPHGIIFDGINNYIYVVDTGSNSVDVIDDANKSVIGSPIPVGHNAFGITLDFFNNLLYVPNSGNNTVSVINGTTNTVLTTIPVGTSPQFVAFDPQTNNLYVTNNVDNTVSVINGTTNAVTGSPIAVGTNPTGITFDPLNGYIYVVNHNSNNITVINGVTNTVVGSPISVGTGPARIVYVPTSNSLYVTNRGSNSVSVINGTTNTVTGSPIPVGTQPIGIIHYGGNGELYVVNDISNNISVISTPNFFTVNTPSSFPSSSSVSAANGAGIVNFQTSSGGISGLRSLTLPSLGRAGLPHNAGLSFGVFSFNVTGLTPGSTDTINMTLPGPYGILPNEQYWKFQNGHWINATSLSTITNNGHNVVLTITDGGFGDSDGVANGVISDPGAPVSIPVPPPHVTITSPANSTAITTSDLTITGTASSTSSTVQNVLVSIDGGSFLAANGTTSWSFTVHGLANGQHTILAEAQDGLGNPGFSYNTNTVIGSPISVGTNPHRIELGAINNNLYVANQNSSSVSVINANTNAVTATIPVGAGPHGIALGNTLSSTINLYVTNSQSNTISVINESSNTVTATIPVGHNPQGIVYGPATGNIYVTNQGDNTVSVINSTTNAVIATIPVGVHPHNIAFDQANSHFYVVNQGDNTVSVVNVANNTVIGSPIPVGNFASDISYDSANTNLYVTNFGDNTVSIINSTTNTVTGTIPVGSGPGGIGFDSANGNLYVANQKSNTVSVINGTTNAVIGSVPVGTTPVSVKFDPINGNVYVSNSVSGTVSVISTPNLFTVNIPATPDFAMSMLNPASATQGAGGSTTVQLSSLGGFSGSVMITLNATTIPSGVSITASQDPLVVQSGQTNSTILSLNVGASVPPGTYTIEVDGTSGAFTHSATFALTVNPSIPPGDFAVTASPVVAVQGNSGPSTVTVTSTSPFSSPVSLSLSGLPSGVTGTFDSNILTPPSGGSVSATVTLSVDSSAAAGSYTINVMGTSGSLVHTSALSLTVGQSIPAGVNNIGPTQPVVLNTNDYTPNSAGSITASSTETITTALIRSSVYPEGILVPLSQTSTPGVFTSTNQVTFTNSPSSYSSFSLFSEVGNTISVSTNYPPTPTFWLSNENGGVLQRFGFGYTGDTIPLVGDWNGAKGSGDKINTVVAFQPSTAFFYLRDANGNIQSFNFGFNKDSIPFVGDFTGTGADTVGVYQPSTSTFWISDGSGHVAQRFQLGFGQDTIPLVGDWNGAKGSGDKIDTVGVYQPSTSFFYLRDANGNIQSFNFGFPGDSIPFVGDFTGTGADTVGVYQPSTSTFWISDGSGHVAQRFQLGFGQDTIPLVGDWNGAKGSGDKIDTVGVYQPSTSFFYLRDANGNLTPINFGFPIDIPIVGDFTGDGKDTFGTIDETGGTTTTATIITNKVPVAGAAVSYSTNLNCIGDSSQDGICDEWKYSQPANGLPAGVNIPINGINYNFACTPGTTYSTDPLGDQVCPAIGTKDVYVEIDYMVGQQPDTTALTQVVNAFLAHNIHLHLLVDDNMGLHYDNIPLTTTLNSDGSVNQIGYFGATGSQGYQQGLKDKFFGTAAERANPHANDLLTAKRQFYHYAMYVHDLTTSGGVTGQSGYGEIGGNDMIISLGEFTNHVGSTAEQAATFMHELGHNLGLDHGGPVTLQSTGQLVTDHSLNCKPNYPSVMNYLYQMPYLVSGRPLDFSEPLATSTGTTSTTITNTLNENSLSESSGIVENVAQGWQAVIGGVDANNNYQQSLASFTGSVDFNRNGITDNSNYAKNIHVFNIPNCDINTNGPATSYATLNSYDDWDNLNLEFRQSQLFQNGFFTINAADPSGSDVANINSLAVSSLADTIGSLPDSAFAPNYAPDMKTILDGELVKVSNAIQEGQLVGTGSASDQLQNIVLPQMTGSGTASTNVLITDPATQKQVSASVNNIINALIAEGTPSSTDSLAPGAQDEVLSASENTPLGIKLNAAVPDPLHESSLLANITNTSHGTLSPMPTGTNLDFSGYSSMTYVPTTNYVGQDQLTFQVKTKDNIGVTHLSNLATVTINIMGGTTMTLSLPTSPVIAGTPTTVTAQVTGFSPSGTVSFSGAGTFTPTNTCALNNGACSVSFTPTNTGQVHVSATYTGDTFNQISSSSGSVTVTQSTTTTGVQLSPSSVTIGNPTTVTAQVTGFSPSGTVSFSGAGTFTPTNTCALNNGACSVSFTPSTPGQTSVSASYSGDANNQASSSNNNGLTISQSTTTTQVQLNPPSIAVGNPTTVIAQVSGFDPSKTVTFATNSTGQFNSTSCVLRNGQCAVTYTPSIVGNGFHKITASYSGDTNNLASSSNAVLTVTQTTSSLSVSLNPTSIQVGGSSSVVVTINGASPSGMISFKAPSGSGQFNSTTCTLNNGACGVTFNALGSPGPITLSASYAGDTNNQASAGSSILTVTQAATATSVSLVPSSVQVGSPTTVTAQVTGFLPSKTVSFTSDSSGSFNSTTCALNNGVCAVTYTPSAVGSGSHKITASYAGDANNLASSGSSTLTVTKYNSETSVSLNPSSVVVGHTSTVTVAVTGISPSSKISFTSDSSGSFNSTTCALNNGVCAVTYTPSAVGSGSHKITASYAGDANNAASSGSSALTVTQTASSESISLNPSSVVVGHTSTVTVAVTGISPSSKISFTSDSSGSFNSTTCALNNGVCAVTYTPSAVGSGSHKITASYAGDANNAASSGSSALTVTQAISTTLVSLTPPSVPAGGTTTVTAQVTGFSPSGTVSFSAPSGAFSSNSCTLNNGACSVTFTASSAGQVTISGSYVGDANNKPNSSTAVLIVASLQGQKTGIASNIKNLESGITDKNIVQKLDRAATHVQKSTDNSLWNADGNTLDLKKGKQVFNEEANSVNLLLKIIPKPTSDDSDLADPGDTDTHDHDLDSLKTSPVSSSLISSLQTIINQLEAIDSTLAQNQINAANSLLTSIQAHHASAKLIQNMQNDINTANSYMQKAQSDLTAGNFHRSIFEYRQAWSFATQAINLGS